MVFVELSQEEEFVILSQVERPVDRFLIRTESVRESQDKFVTKSQEEMFVLTFLTKNTDAKWLLATEVKTMPVEELSKFLTRLIEK